METLPRSCVRGERIHASPSTLMSPIPVAVCSWNDRSGQMRDRDPVETGTLTCTRYRSLIEYATSATNVWILKTGDWPPGANEELSSVPTYQSLDTSRRYASVTCHSRAR